MNNDTLEQKALAVRANRAELLKRLNWTKSVLVDELRKRMKGAKFDFQNARLVSLDGGLVLQWQTRRYPNTPESYENQQTSTGNVTVIHTPRASGKQGG